MLQIVVECRWAHLVQVVVQVVLLLVLVVHLLVWVAVAHYRGSVAVVQATYRLRMALAVQNLKLHMMMTHVLAVVVLMRG